LAAVLAERLLSLGAQFVDYPTLLRLNPNTPWKTRGNASVCLRFHLDEDVQGEAKKATLELVERYGEFWCENTNPGVVFHVGEVPVEAKAISDRTVKQIVSLSEAEALIEGYGMAAVGWKNRRGIIGALAAVGGTLEGDHTYEILTYRAPENWGEERRVDAEAVREMDRVLSHLTFNNIDEAGHILITPHGPDPVLYGVRGESAEAVLQAFNMVKALEPVERWMIYRSNQGTDAHFSAAVKVRELKPFNPAVIEAKVSGFPETLQGGHVIFKMSDGLKEVDCAAYEPTGGFRRIVWALIPGDRLRAYGGVRENGGRVTLNLEKLELISLVEDVGFRNPRCPVCSGSMESMGRDQGYRCKKCGHRGRDLVKTAFSKPRDLKPGVYLPDRGAHRHLTKPYERYGREKKYTKFSMIEGWIGFPCP